MIQVSVSNTNTKPIIINKISCLVIIAILPIVSPSDKLPVSPINILAGFKLKNREPKSDPAIEKQNNEISSYPSNHPVL